MSKKGSDVLHKLIKSLTKAEKRYFKVYASRHTRADDSNTVLIFDTMDSYDEYDEDDLLKKYKGEAFANNFSIVKARIYETVLRSLDAFHANSSIEAELHRELHYAEILYKKSLYDQCVKVLTSAKKLAAKYEKHSTLLEIYLWEKKLIEKDNYSGKTEEDINKFLDEDKFIVEKIKNFSDYWNIKSRLFMILNKKGKVRTDEELQNFKSYIDNTLLKTESQALSVETKYLYHHIYSAYYFGFGDYENCYWHLGKNVELIESSTHIFEEEPNVYFSVLTNIIYIGSQLKKYDELFSYLRKLHNVPRTFDITKNEDLQIKLFSSVYSVEITLYNTLGDFEKALELVPKIEEGLKKFEGKINKLREAYFYSSIAVANFGAEKYSTALKWINRLLNDKEIEQHQDTHCFSMIFNLIIHLELKNDEHIPYTFKSTSRYLTHKQRVYKFENSFLDFAEHLMKDKKKESQQLYYEKLFSELKELQGDNFEKAPFEYFDFVSWAESKAKKIPFREIVEEKSKAKS